MLMIISIVPIASLCGQDLVFELPIYFEDAVGNRDTVLLAYGTGITAENRFGNTETRNYYGDSMFLKNDLDIWMSQMYNDDINVRGRMSKVWYSEFDDRECLDAESDGPIFIDLLIRNIYPPLTISWDEAVLCSNMCTSETIFIDNFIYSVVSDQTIIDNNLAYSMCGVNGQMILPLGSLVREDGMIGYQTMHHEIDSTGELDIIYLFHIYMNNFLNYLVSSTEMVPTQSLQVFPNPATDNLYIKGLEGRSRVALTVFDMMGRVVNDHKIELGSMDLQYDVSFLPAGTYTLVIRDAAGLLQHHRFVKI